MESGEQAMSFKGKCLNCHSDNIKISDESDGMFKNDPYRKLIHYFCNNCRHHETVYMSIDMKIGLNQ